MSVVAAIERFFQIQGFMPHGMCLLWRPSILWTIVFGNAVIALAYFMIPIALIYLIIKRRDIGFKWIFVLFGAFILACGLTHVMSVVTLWIPAYGLEAIVLAITGIVSMTTAILLWPLLPLLFKIPSPWTLERMNDELLRKNEELAKSELIKSRLAAIVEFTDESIISQTLDGIINSWNQGAEHLYGYCSEEIIGQSIAVLFPAHRLTELSEIENQIKTGTPLHYLETERRHKDGHLIPVSVTISPIKDQSGQLIGACSIERDITEWQQIQKMKDEFISIVSHELRTPLTSIQGSLALLVGGAVGDIPEKAQKFLLIGKQNTDRLIRLINDMLDIAKIEAGKIDFKIETIDLNALVKEAMELNKAFAEKYGIKMILVENAQGTVNADRDRLLQVITNLLSNAIKFSQHKQDVIINISQNDNKLRVAIINKGVGIPKEFQPKIFRKFSQVNTSSSRDHSGTGLGLSISKEIIERLKGKIGFSSEENKETTFFFELPMASSLPVKKRFYEKIPTVLICQDDIHASNQLRKILDENGFKSIIVTSAEEASKVLALQHIDALLLDLMLPNTDAVAYLKELRLKYTSNELPIIAISFSFEQEKELSGNGFLLLDWLEKPINTDRLFSDIQLIKKQVEQHTPTVLFVEDEVDLIEIKAKLLQNEANIVGATTLQEARAALAKNTFDLVVLDLLLPDGSGVDLLAEISGQNIPVIVFSAFELPKNYTHYVVKTLMKSKTSPHDFLKVIHASLFNQKLDEKQSSDF